MIETAQSYHLKDIVRIGEQYYKESPYVTTHEFEANTLLDWLRRAMIIPHAEVAVATWEDRVVGVCVGYLSEYAWTSGLRTHIEFLFVLEEYRKHELAEQLLEHLEAWSRKMNSQEILAGDLGLRPRLTERFLKQQGYQDPGVLLRKVLNQ